MLYGKVLPFLWFIPTRIEISLDMVWVKNAFRICTDPLRTPHRSIKKNSDSRALLNDKNKQIKQKKNAEKNHWILDLSFNIKHQTSRQG